MEKLNNCPVCDKNSFLDYKKIKDYFLSNREFTIQQCEFCGFKFVNPRPEKSQLQEYYKSEDYISHSDTKQGLINKVYHIFRNYNLKKKYSLIKSYSSGNKLLDIGCATGAFLNFCRKKGMMTVGIEPGDKAREFAVTNHGLDVRNEQELVNLHEQEFDAVTLWHVMEHVSTLNSHMEQINRVLKNDGTVFIAVPNFESYDAEKYGEFWAAWDVPRHIYHFSRETMKLLIEKHGFELCEIVPMKLDAYYVSLLSEKYKTGKSNYLNAILSGFKSNCKAKKNNLNYSSLIYVAKKTLGGNNAF